MHRLLLWSTRNERIWNLTSNVTKSCWLLSPLIYWHNNLPPVFPWPAQIRLQPAWPWTPTCSWRSLILGAASPGLRCGYQGATDTTHQLPSSALLHGYSIEPPVAYLAQSTLQPSAQHRSLQGQHTVCTCISLKSRSHALVSPAVGLVPIHGFILHELVGLGFDVATTRGPLLHVSLLSTVVTSLWPKSLALKAMPFLLYTKPVCSSIRQRGFMLCCTARASVSPPSDGVSSGSYQGHVHMQCTQTP